jgi:uncharacterized protein YjbI with pentapeptide repeats
MKTISYVSIGFIFFIVALSLLSTHVYATSSDCTARGPGVDLSGCNLSGVDLTGANLTDVS